MVLIAKAPCWNSRRAEKMRREKGNGEGKKEEKASFSTIFSGWIPGKRGFCYRGLQWSWTHIWKETMNISDQPTITRLLLNSSSSFPDNAPNLTAFIKKSWRLLNLVTNVFTLHSFRREPVKWQRKMRLRRSLIGFNNQESEKCYSVLGWFFDSLFARNACPMPPSLPGWLFPSRSSELSVNQTLDCRSIKPFRIASVF